MTSSGDSNAPRRRDSGDRTAVRSEALDVLSDVLLWQLAEPRWQAIEQILVAMDAALAQGDMDALEEATADLELAGPVRLIPIGPAVGPTPVARDLLNRLVHSLGGVTAPGQAGEPEDPGAGHADTTSS
jgi:CATRA-associated small protein